MTASELTGGSRSYLLVHNPPLDPADGHGLGWSLVVFESGRRRRTINLAAHGAPATARAAVAQAVATRVLADQGVDTRGWANAEPAELPDAFSPTLVDRS